MKRPCKLQEKAQDQDNTRPKNTTIQHIKTRRHNITQKQIDEGFALLYLMYRGGATTTTTSCTTTTTTTTTGGGSSKRKDKRRHKKKWQNKKR